MCVFPTSPTRTSLLTTRYISALKPNTALYLCNVSHSLSLRLILKPKSPLPWGGEPFIFGVTIFHLPGHVVQTMLGNFDDINVECGGCFSCNHLVYETSRTKYHPQHCRCHNERDDGFRTSGAEEPLRGILRLALDVWRAFVARWGKRRK